MASSRDQRHARDPEPGTFSFGCDDCSLQASDHCHDCVVSYICSEEDAAVVVSMDELRLVRSLQAGGLAPPLRYSPVRHGPDGASVAG